MPTRRPSLRHPASRDANGAAAPSSTLSLRHYPDLDDRILHEVAACLARAFAKKGRTPKEIRWGVAW